MAIYKVRHIVIFNNVSENMNIHHYEFPGYVPTPTELQEFVDGFNGAYRVNLRPHYSTAVSVQPIGVRRVDIAGQPEQFITPTAGLWSGIEGGEPLPSWLGVLVVWKAPTVFPRTSRAFGMALTEAANGGFGAPIQTVRDAYAAFAAELLTIPVTGQESAVKVAAEYQVGTGQVGATNVLTTFNVRPFWGTQRRRRSGVGS